MIDKQKIEITELKTANLNLKNDFNDLNNKFKSHENIQKQLTNTEIKSDKFDKCKPSSGNDLNKTSQNNENEQNKLIDIDCKIDKINNKSKSSSDPKNSLNDFKFKNLSSNKIKINHMHNFRNNQQYSSANKFDKKQLSKNDNSVNFRKYGYSKSEKKINSAGSPTEFAVFPSSPKKEKNSNSIRKFKFDLKQSPLENNKPFNISTNNLQNNNNSNNLFAKSLHNINSYNLFEKNTQNDLFNNNTEKKTKSHKFSCAEFLPNKNNDCYENKFEIEPLIKSSNNFINNHLENLKWFDMYARVPNLFNPFNNRKLTFKIGIGRIPFGRENSGKLEIKIPSDYID